MGDSDVFVKRVDFEVNNNQTVDLTPIISNGDASTDVEKAPEPTRKPGCTAKFCGFLDKFGIKTAMSHIGLLVSLGLYCYGGGWVFQHLELPVFNKSTQELRENLISARVKFIDDVIDKAKTQSLTEEFLKSSLVEYESAAEAAVQGTLLLQNADGDTIDGENTAFPVKEQIWTIGQAVFFASTVCTTIGYGNIVPTTFEGQLFCIIFAIIGIPFTLTVIADYGNLFANSVSWMAKKCKSIKMCNRDQKAKKLKGRKWLYALGAVVFLGIYLSAGAAVFHQWEDGWSFFDGFYFSFITMTTIGFGDLVPKDRLMMCCAVYILIGLALTSTILELVRRQYVQSWQKLQQLKLGSFADSLRRLGESHGAIDINDLRSILSVSLPKRDKKEKKTNEDGEMDTLEALTNAILREVKVKQIEKPRLVQIIIYESSV